MKNRGEQSIRKEVRNVPVRKVAEMERMSKRSWKVTVAPGVGEG
jgi:hypothetical protein